MEEQLEEKSDDYTFVEKPELVNEGYGFYSINGIIKNNTDRDKGFIDITFILYDKDGNNIGSAYASGESLKAGGNWKFSASCFSEVDSEEIADFELDSVF